MDWRKATSHCFVCGNELSDYYCQFKWQQKSVDDGRSSCVSTMCALLTFDYESSKAVFANSSFCEVCLETIFEVELILKATLNMQMKLNQIKNQVLNLLHARYKTLYQSTNSAQTSQEDLFQIVTALGIKTEVKIEDDELQSFETDPLELLETEETGFILSTPEPSAERLRYRKARQQSDTTPLALVDEADLINIAASKLDPLTDHTVRLCPSTLSLSGIETAANVGLDQVKTNPFQSIEQRLPIKDSSNPKLTSKNVYYAVLSNPTVPSGMGSMVGFGVYPRINESNAHHTQIKLSLTCNFRNCQDRKPLFKNLSDIQKHFKLEHYGHGIQTPYHCALCVFRTETTECLQRHIQLHLQTKQDPPLFFCNMCKSGFVSLTQLNTHKLASHLISDTDICEKQFQDKESSPKRVASSLRTAVAVPGPSKKSRPSEQANGEMLNDHKCSICFARYHSTEQVKSHEARHQRQDPFRCVICSNSVPSFPAKQNLIDHVALEHNGESRKARDLFPCNFPECSATNFILRKRTEMVEHLAEVHQYDEQKRYLTHHCTQCNRQYQKFYHLKQHIDTNHMIRERSFTCPVCGTSFLSNVSLTSHLRSIHTVTLEPPRCSRCSKKFDSNEERSQHESRHSEETPFSCVLCSEKLQTTAELHRHVADVHESLPFPCIEEGCKRSFISKQRLLTHQSGHKKFLPLQKCPHCYFQSRVANNLKVHMARHTTKDISCTVEGCSGKFSWKNELTKHLRFVHKIGKPIEIFPCPVCKKEFKSLSHLAGHERFHGTEHPFMCEICSSRFKTKGTLGQHLKQHAKWEKLGIEQPKPRKKKTSRFVLVGGE